MWAAVRWLCGALMAAGGVASVCGNLLILLLLVWDQEARSDTRVFTLSLALSDLALAISAVPFGAYNSLSGGPGPGGAPCQAAAFLLLLLQTASLHSLAWTTVDKFTEICFALSYRRLWPAARTRMVLVLVWAFSLLSAALPLLGAGRYAYSEPRFLCGLSFTPENRLFVGLWVAAGVMAPIATTCSLHGYIVHVARKQARRGTFRCNQLHCYYVPANTYLRSSVVMATTSVSLLLCWLPFVSVCLYETSSGLLAPPLLSSASSCLLLSCASFTPWITCLTHTYRSAARRRLRRLVGSCCEGPQVETRPQSSALQLDSTFRISTTATTSTSPPSLPRKPTSHAVSPTESPNNMHV